MRFPLAGQAMDNGGPNQSVVCVAGLKSVNVGAQGSFSVRNFEVKAGLESGSLESRPLHDSRPGLGRLLVPFYLGQQNLDSISYALPPSNCRIDLRGPGAYDL